MEDFTNESLFFSSLTKMLHISEKLEIKLKPTS